MILAVHLVLVGAWLGAVLVAALAERALLGQGREQDLLLARLRWKIDRLVALPLLLAVIATGARLLPAAPGDPWFKAKLACGALAIFANLYCIWLVRLRLRMAEAGAWDLFAIIARRQHQVGAVVLIALLAAMGLGIVH